MGSLKEIGKNATGRIGRHVSAEIHRAGRCAGYGMVCYTIGGPPRVWATVKIAAMVMEWLEYPHNVTHIQTNESMIIRWDGWIRDRYDR